MFFCTMSVAKVNGREGQQCRKREAKGAAAPLALFQEGQRGAKGVLLNSINAFHQSIKKKLKSSWNGQFDLQ